MLENIIAYAKTIQTVRKADILKSIELMESTVTNDILPTLKQVYDSSDIKSIKDNKVFKDLTTMSKLKVKDNADYINSLIGFFNSMVDNKDLLINTVKGNLSDVLTDKSVTVKQAAILMLVSDLNSMYLFVLDLCYGALSNKNTTSMSKKKLEDINEGMKSFSSLFSYYNNDLTDKIKALSKLPDDLVVLLDGNDDPYVATKLATAMKGFSLPGLSGFINNPIYHFRMWLVDRDMQKLANLKDEKALLENRLMELKLEAQGERSEQVMKQIAYYENKIETTEYKIKRLEDLD